MEVGSVLSGVAAVGVMLNGLTNRRHHHDNTVKIDEINKAVNNKAPDEPTLRELVVMAVRALGQLEGKFDSHAEQDLRAFNEIRGEFDELRQHATPSKETP